MSGNFVFSCLYKPCLSSHLRHVLLFAQKPPFNSHADVSSGAKGLNFGPSFHLHSYFAYASKREPWLVSDVILVPKSHDQTRFMLSLSSVFIEIKVKLSFTEPKYPGI